MGPSLSGLIVLLRTRICSPGSHVPGSDRARCTIVATCAAEPVLSKEPHEPVLGRGDVQHAAQFYLKIPTAFSCLSA
jgi:hypothetical protein